jgi:hypothetical protein
MNLPSRRDRCLELRFIQAMALASAIVVLTTGRFAMADFGFDSEKLKADDSTPISASEGRAQRVGPKLILKLANGQTITFADEDKCDGGAMRDPRCVIRRFAGYDGRIRMFLVSNVYWEWGDYDLVSEVTGSDVKLPKDPHFSPAGGLFVVVSARECCGENVIQMWRTRGGYSNLEWQHVPRGYALYNFRTWIDEDHVSLTVILHAGNGLQELPAALVYRNPGWHIEGPPELP